jgi:HSP20 family protein
MYLTLLNERKNSVSTFDKVFDELLKKQFPELQKETGLSFTQGSYPKVNVIEFEDKVRIVAEIAGLTKDDIKIDIDEYVMTISGDSQIKNDEQGVYLIKELKHSSFKRSFTFGDKFNMDDVSAEFNEGILNIEIAKKTPEPKVSKRVEITSKSNKKLLKS